MWDKTENLSKSPCKDPAVLEQYISGCASGDSQALSLLYSAVSASVYAYSLSVLKNRQDAEDVLHDCFINVYSASASYRSCGRPMAWIMTIAKNLCMNTLKERSRSTQAADEDWESCLSAHEGISAEDRLTVQACMEQLSDSERRIMVLHAVSGFKHREIAEFLGIPLATVLSKYSRAVKKMRIYLEKEIAR